MIRPFHVSCLLNFFVCPFIYLFISVFRDSFRDSLTVYWNYCVMKLSCVLEILSYPYHLTPSKQVQNSSFNPVTEPYEKIKPTDESRLQFNYSAACCLKTVCVYTSLCVWRVCSLAYLETQEFAFHQGVKHLRTQTQLTGPHTHTWRLTKQCNL